MLGKTGDRGFGGAPRYSSRDDPRPTMIVAVSSHPAQYRAPLYRFLSRQPDTAIHAVYLRDTHVRESYDPDFAAVFRWATNLLGGRHIIILQDSTQQRRFSFRRSLFATFAAVRQAVRTVSSPRGVLLHSYVTPEGLGGLLAAKASRLPAMLMSESELLRPRSLSKRTLRNLILPPVLKLYDALLCIGTHNRSFYQHYGVREERLFFTPYCVDNVGFLVGFDQHLAARDATRTELGAGPTDRVLLFAGKLIERKRPLDIIRAVATLEPALRPVVVFMGSGQLASNIREIATTLGVGKYAITGFKNADEIGRYYAAADAFVLPSDFETWGLVVNEAMVHALPTIVSDRCGCAIDLVQDGRTGYRFPAGDTVALADRIGCVLRHEGQRRAMGASARALIDSWSFAEVELGMKKALAFLAPSAAERDG